MSIDEHIETARRLPLLDAAYYLWAKRLTLDQIEHPLNSKKARSTDLWDPERLIKSAAAAIEKAKHDRVAAADGPTFSRLRRAHPSAPDDELKAAIRGAVKLDDDCARFFRPGGRDFADLIAEAVDSARRENPGFGEQTYELARSELARTMK